MRRKDGKCSGCKDVDADPNDMYCKPCRKERNRLQYVARRTPPKARHANACCCSNPTCNGLSCDVVRV